MISALPTKCTRFLILIGLLGLFLFSQKAEAQGFFQFGQNKVNYEMFDWRYIETEHFDIYYYDSKNYYLAEFAAHTLESSLEQARVDWNHQINDRIPVILYDSSTDFTQTNVIPFLIPQSVGGVTDLYRNRITMPFDGDYDRFRHVLQHELSHAVSNDFFYGGSFQNVVQQNIQFERPLWFEEGLAEFVSLGWDTDTDMFMRDLVVNANIPQIPQLGGFLAYRGGQSVWYYIAEEYGREKVPEILERSRTTRSVQAGMRQSLGLSLSELTERWQDWLKERYYPEIANRERVRDIGRNVTRENFRGSYNTSPTISPQGDRMAMITNRRGYFDVVLLDSSTGEKIQTIVRGEDDVDFEELNILNPNLTWAPDGEKIALSTRADGKIDIAIVDVDDGETRRLKFPNLDAIKSVAWSPDGEKIAFNGNIGPYPDIFIYNLETDEFTNVTNDVFTDKDPAWSPDSEYLLFSSDRGSRVELGRYRTNYSVLTNPDLTQRDIYRVRVGNNRAERLTHTRTSKEKRPLMTTEGDLLYISDQNGIPNIFKMDMDERTSVPLTNLLVGVQQMSISSDGRMLAMNTYNRGALDIFVINNITNRVREDGIEPNEWAERRRAEPDHVRVPAIGIARERLRDDEPMRPSFLAESQSLILDGFMQQQMAQPDQEGEPDDTVEVEEDGTVDFRNYVFSDEFDDLIDDTEARRFDPEDNRTDDGRYVPRRYRLSFAPDLTYFGGGAVFGTGFGAQAITQIEFSDILGDHRLGISSNLVFDLRNSDYIINYTYLRSRTNISGTYFHSARQFARGIQAGQRSFERVRNYGFGLNFRYPFNRFDRVDYGVSMIAISRDITGVQGAFRNDKNYFLNPSVTFTRDRTLQGAFFTPRAGRRMAVQLNAAPPVGRDDFLQFGTLSGDFRQYYSIANFWTFAFRFSGGTSFGENAQYFLLGGMQNWINYSFEDRQVDPQVAESIFFTMPAWPMRGHRYNAGIGNTFALANLEFRYPLVAAILPGPIPILPLYNIQGTMFTDVGGTWLNDTFQNFEQDSLLAGAGLGLRTIVLGLPVRWDVAWPYEVGEGFGRRVHYFSIGLDF